VTPAKKSGRHRNARKKTEAIVAKDITAKNFERHLKPLLLGK
jgi:hypothetical protein